VKAILLTLLILGMGDLALRWAEVNLSIDVRHIRSFPEITRKLSHEPAPRVVFLGNSLTRHGVDPSVWASAMKELKAPAGSMAKLVPDDTTMPDWYYVALNSLIVPGYQPDILILGFASNQLTDERIEASRLGAYFCDHGNLRELFAKDLEGVAAKGDFAGREPFAELDQLHFGNQVARSGFAQEVDVEIRRHRKRHRSDRG